MKEKEYYSVEELAKKFDKTPYTIRVWLRNGVIKGRRLGKYWYIPTRSISTLLEEE